MPDAGILLVILEPAHRAVAAALIAAAGEPFAMPASLAKALADARTGRFDLVMIDLDPVDGRSLIGALRARHDGMAAVPILALGAIEGCDASLPKPYRAASFEATMRSLLGRDFRVAQADQRQRLVELLGAEQADAMISRYFSGLAEAIGEVEAGGDAAAIGHRLGGMGGMLGFDLLGTAWLTLEDHGPQAWPLVRELTLEAIERHRQRQPTTGPGGIGA